MPIKFLTEAYFFQAWGSLTRLKSQTRDPQLKVPPGGLVLRIFMSWKNPLTSAWSEPVNLGSWGEHITPRPPRPTYSGVSVNKKIAHTLVSLLFYCWWITSFVNIPLYLCHWSNSLSNSNFLLFISYITITVLEFLLYKKHWRLKGLKLLNRGKWTHICNWY